MKWVKESLGDYLAKPKRLVVRHPEYVMTGADYIDYTVFKCRLRQSYSLAIVDKYGNYHSPFHWGEYGAAWIEEVDGKYYLVPFRETMKWGDPCTMAMVGQQILHVLNGNHPAMKKFSGIGWLTDSIIRPNPLTVQDEYFLYEGVFCGFRPAIHPKQLQNICIHTWEFLPSFSEKAYLRMLRGIRTSHVRSVSKP